jgi:hypothetical protein
MTARHGLPFVAATLLGPVSGCGTAATPESIRHPFVDAAPAGDWFTLTAADRPPAFLVDATARHRLQLGEVSSPFVWSADGRRLAWRADGRWRSEIASVWVDVPDGAINRVPIAAETRASVNPLALSRDGQRLLVQERRTLRLIEVDTGRETGRGESGPVRVATFLRDGSVRMVVSPTGAASDGELSLCDWDFRGPTVAVRWTLPTEGGARTRLTPDGERLLVDGRRGLSLYASDGHRIAAPVEPWGGVNHVAAILSNRGVLAVEENGAALRLRVFGSDGQVRIDTAIPGKFPVLFGGEPAPALISIGVAPRETLFIDAASGEIRRREPGMLPAGRWEDGRWADGDTSTIPATGSVGTRLFWDTQHALVSVDPVSGPRRTVLTMAGGG